MLDPSFQQGKAHEGQRFPQSEVPNGGRTKNEQQMVGSTICLGCGS